MNPVIYEAVLQSQPITTKLQIPNVMGEEVINLNKAMSDAYPRA
jgi:hypothetical protein